MSAGVFSGMGWHIVGSTTGSICASITGERIISS